MGKRFSVTYKDGKGKLQEKQPLSVLASLRRYDFPSVKEVIAYKGQPRLPGFFWMSRQDTLVEYESLLAMSSLVQLDFNPSTLSVLPNPFVIHADIDYAHVPSYLAWLSPDDGLVIDVISKQSLERAHNQNAIALNQQFCDQAGWKYTVQSEPDPIFYTNLRWLMGFRRKPEEFERYAEPIIDCCADAPRSVGVLVSAVGPAYIVRPILYHLLWRRLLHVDLYAPLTNQSLVDLPKE